MQSSSEDTGDTLIELLSHSTKGGVDPFFIKIYNIHLGWKLNPGGGPWLISKYESDDLTFNSSNLRFQSSLKVLLCPKESPCLAKFWSPIDEVWVLFVEVEK